MGAGHSKLTVDPCLKARGTTIVFVTCEHTHFCFDIDSFVAFRTLRTLIFFFMTCRENDRTAQAPKRGLDPSLLQCHIATHE
jgi:hypothetical protein